jgi:hypothetical protein
MAMNKIFNNKIFGRINILSRQEITKLISDALRSLFLRKVESKASLDVRYLTLS